MLIGFGTGSVIGLSSGDTKTGLVRFEAEEKAIIYGSIFSFFGGIIGGSTGYRKIKIPIYGNRKNYLKQKAELKKYLLSSTLRL